MRIRIDYIKTPIRKIKTKILKSKKANKNAKKKVK